jgi:hypothetical protein
MVSVAAVLVALVLLIVGIPITTVVPAPVPGVRFPVAVATLGGLNGSPVALLPSFLGVNARADAPLTWAGANALNGTDVKLVRWPGGGLADRFDPLANGDAGTIYNDTGSATPAETSLSSFVDWCEAVACRSVITLPAEPNSTATALAIVNYTESTLGFTPTYWEIGNEPALWRHFGIPWAQWNATQNATPTPDQFAALVHRFVQAIRSVDTTAGIIGLGGIGAGSGGRTTWVATDAAQNGANLSGIAIHVYPAGPGFPSSDITDWFASLGGHSALPYRVPTTVSEIRSGCGSCRVAVFVDEFQTGSLLTPADSLTGGYLAAYVAAEIVQALPLPVQSLDYYNFESGTPGAWFDLNGGSSSAYALYSGLATYLGSYAAQVNVTSSARGLLAAKGAAAPGPLGTNLILVNTNTSFGFRLNLTREFPAAANGTAWVFNGTAGTPTIVAVGAAGAVNWTVAPASVVILHGLGASSLAPRTPGGSSPGVTSLQAPPAAPVPRPTAATLSASLPTRLFALSRWA